MSQRYTAGESPNVDKINQMFIAKYNTTERDALTVGQKFTGMVIWNTTTTQHEWWDGTQWLRLPRLIGSPNTLTGSVTLIGSVTPSFARNLTSPGVEDPAGIPVIAISASVAEQSVRTIASHANASPPGITTSEGAWGIRNTSGATITFTYRLKRGTTVISSESQALGDGGTVGILKNASEELAGTFSYEITVQPDASATYKVHGSIIIMNIDDNHSCSDTHSCGADTHTCA